MQPTTATLASGSAAGAFVAIICWVLSEYAIIVPVNVALAMAVALTWAWGNVFHRPTSIPDNVVQMPTKGFTLCHTALTLMFVGGGILLILGLSGCAEWQAGAAGLNAAGMTMAQNAADDALVANKETFCAQPYSSLVRNSAKDPVIGGAAVLVCGQLVVPKMVVTNNATVTATTP